MGVGCIEPAVAFVAEGWVLADMELIWIGTNFELKWNEQWFETNVDMERTLIWNEFGIKMDFELK